jgi:hypothetical protein
MIRLLTLPFRLAWIPTAWSLRLLGFGAGIERHRRQPPLTDSEHHVSSVLRSTSGKVLVPLAVFLAVAIATVGAFAYYTSSGTGSASASVGTLNPPTGVTASAAGSTVTVSWVAPSSGVAPQGYYVQRYLGSTPSPACGTSAISLTTPSSAITCADTSVPTGTYTYTVTAVYNSWTAASSAGAPVTVNGSATKLAFTTTAQTLTAGVTSGSITVEREDGSGNPTTLGTTTVNLSTSSTGAVFRDSADSSTITAVTIGPGASSASFEYRDTVAGGPTITATDAAAVLTSATQVETVNATVANKLAFTTPPVGNVSEGTNFFKSPAVSIEDTFGNVVTTDTGSVTLAAASYSAAGGGGTTQGSLSCSSTLTVAGVSGVAHFTGCQITGNAAAGTYTLSATRSGLTTVVSGNVVINAGAASAAQSTLTPTSSSIVANGTSTEVLTVQAKDTNGNNLSTGGATVTITKSSGTGTIGTVTDHGDGTYTATVTSPTATGSGTFVATFGGSSVSSGGGSQTQATVTYTAGAFSAAKSTLTPTSSSIAANGVSTQVLTVQAKDANGNSLSTGGATVTITKSSGTGTISSVTDNGTGTYTATVTSPTTAGSGIFVATIGGSAVQSGGGAQTQATVSYSTAASAAHVQDAAFTGSGAALTSVSPSLSSPPTNGDTLIVFVGDDGSGGATVSGVSGGGVPTWTKATSAIGSGAPGNGNANNGELEIWYGVVNCSGACSAGNEVVTVSLSANTNVQMATVSEWSGIATNSPVDSAASLAVATRSGTGFTTSSLTPTQTGDLVVSSAWVDNKAGGTSTAQNAASGYTQLAETNATGSFYRGYDAYQFDGNTNPIAATWPNPASNSYAWAIAAFKTNAVPDTTPPTGAITAPANGAAVHGTVTVSSSSADTASGVASAQFQYSPHSANTWTTIGTDATGPYSSPWNTTGLAAGQYDLRVITTDNATNTFASAPVTVTVDNTAPTGSIGYSGGYNTSGTVLVIFSASDSGSGLNSGSGQLSRASASLLNGSCGGFGAFAPVGPAGVVSPYSDGSVITGNCYEYEYVLPDNAGNVATITSASVVKVDKAGPTNSLALTGQTGGASYLSGNTIYYQGSSAGSFQLQNTVLDTSSGPASSQFGSLGGSVANWMFAGSTVSSPAGGPYVSPGFSWVSGTTGSATEVVTGADAAGNTTATTITLTNDTTAPGGGSVTANGSGGMSWVKAASVPVSFSAGTDAGSGVNSAGGKLFRGSSVYNAATATCGAISTFPTQVGLTGLGSPFTDTGVSTGNCYAYEYQVADNVGNVQTYGPSAVVAVDSAAPTVTVTNAAGQAAATGSLPIAFTVTFSEPVLGFTAGDLTRTGGSTGGNVVLSGTGPVYTVTVTNPGSNLTNGSIGFTIAAGGVTDNALNNNTASTGSPDSVTYDTIAPTQLLTFSGATGHELIAGSGDSWTVYYNGNTAGSFKLSDAVTETGSGIATNGITFPTMAATAGWTAPPVTTSCTITPCLSNTYTWTANPSGNPADETITALDNAGNTDTVTLHFVNDSIAPSGGSVTANGSGGMSWVKSASVPVSFSAGTDAGSGVNSAGGKLFRGSSVYNAATATCGAISTFPTQVGLTGLGSPFTDTGVSTGNCYAYEYQVADNVGNVQTYGPSAVVAVDSAAPTVTVTNAAGQAAATGSLPIAFTVTFSEPVLGFTAGDLTRTGGSTGGNVVLSGTGPVYTVTVTNPGSNLTNGSIGFTIAAGGVTDNALNNNTASTGSPDSVTYDTIAPTQLLTFSGATGHELIAGSGDSWTVYYNGNTAGSFKLSDAVTETGSGIATNGITFPTMAATAGWTAPPVTTSCTITPCLSNTYTWTANPSGNPADETITALDNAGNTDTVTLHFVNDSIAPTQFLTFSGATGHELIAGSGDSWTVYYNGNTAGSFKLSDAVTETGSGIATNGITFPTMAASTRWTAPATKSCTTSPCISNTYTWAANPGNPADETITAVDNVGNIDTITLHFVNDSVAPASTAVLSPPANGAGWDNSDTTVNLSSSDTGGSGVQQITYSATGAQTISSTTVPGAAAAPVISAEGTTTVSYFATDNLGNVETTKTVLVKLDKTNPNAPTMTTQPSTFNNGHPLTVSAASDNPGGSGVASVSYYYCPGSSCAPSTLIGTGSTAPGYSLTWNAQPSDGAYTIGAKTNDAAGNASALSATQTVTIDNTTPTVTGVVLANGTTSTMGQADAGDTLTVTYSEVLNATSICSGWTNGATQTATATVTISPGDALTVTGASCGTLNFGSVALGGNYDSSGGNNRTWTASITWNPSSDTFQVGFTSNGNGGTEGTAQTNHTPSYSPNTNLTDVAGNAISGSAVNGTSSHF